MMAETETYSTSEVVTTCIVWLAIAGLAALAYIALIV